MPIPGSKLDLKVKGRQQLRSSSRFQVTHALVHVISTTGKHDAAYPGKRESLFSETNGRSHDVELDKR